MKQWVPRLWFGYFRQGTDIESVIKNKKLLGKYIKIKNMYKKKNLWKYADIRGLIPQSICVLFYSIAKYECSANVIYRTFKQWYLRKILEENTKLPTDVINYCIFPFLINKKTRIIV